MADRAKRAWRLALAALVSAATAGGSAVSADELTVPSPVERDSPLTAAYRFDQPVTGHGSLDVEWTDVDGRVVDRRHIPIDLADAAQVTFRLDIRRAVTVVNRLAAHLSLDGVDQGGAPVHRRTDLSASFIASPPDQGWWDYQIIMWQGQTPAAYRALKRLGITGGMVEANHRSRRRPMSRPISLALLDQNLRFYLESIAPDFYSPYHRWSGDRPVNWRFLAAEALHRRNPDDIAGFTRDPSLSDPRWLAKIQARLTRDVQALRPYRPLYYNLGDETGIADLASFWDFDFSRYSLEGMRGWLRQRYGSVAALNREWGSHFEGWDHVMPMTTRQAIEKPDQNFAAWADFKQWMDVVFARALAGGAAAVHAADPGALAAIEGVQVPGWGGYDYPRLARSVDAMEPYDFDADIQMLRSLNPQLVLLTTLFASGREASYLTWRELVRGTRGLILWDENNDFVAKDGRLGQRGMQAAADFAEIRGGLGALLINSRRHTDPVAVLYSQESLRIAWLLDRRVRGQRDQAGSADKALGAAPRTSSHHFVRTIEHLGIEPRFISASALEKGALRAGGTRILMLPDALALSPNQAAEIRDFVARGGSVLADGEPGLFDEHGSRLRQPMLSDVFTGPPDGAATRFRFGRGTATYISFPDGAGSTGARHIAGILAAAGVEAPFPVARADGGPADDIETHVLDNGPARILAVQHDLSAPARAISSPTGATGREAIVVTLPRQLDVYDLRTRRALGETDRVALDLGPGEAAILSLSPTPLAAPAIAGPAAARLGENAEFHIRLSSPEAPGVVHIDILDPNGRVMLPYSGNLLAAHGEALKLLPLAVNDQAGVWKIRATDVLSGQTATAELTVGP